MTDAELSEATINRLAGEMDELETRFQSAQAANKRLTQRLAGLGLVTANKREMTTLLQACMVLSQSGIYIDDEHRDACDALDTIERVCNGLLERLVEGA